MIDLQISQKEAEKFFKEKKYRIDDTRYTCPEQGGILCIPLKAHIHDHEFILDVRRGAIELKKTTLQLRVKKSIILARLDLGGLSHRNPDGKKMHCPHLHLYREGFDDQWAFPLPKEFTDIHDAWLTLDQFMNYCNVVEKPFIGRK